MYGYRTYCPGHLSFSSSGKPLVWFGYYRFTGDLILIAPAVSFPVLFPAQVLIISSLVTRSISFREPLKTSNFFVGFQVKMLIYQSKLRFSLVHPPRTSLFLEVPFSPYTALTKAAKWIRRVLSVLLLKPLSRIFAEICRYLMVFQ